MGEYKITKLLNNIEPEDQINLDTLIDLDILTEEPAAAHDFKIGDKIQVQGNVKVPSWVFNKVMIVKNVYPNGDLSISTSVKGPQVGVIKNENAIFLGEDAEVIIQNNVNTISYLVIIADQSLDVKVGPGYQYRVNGNVKKNEVYTIIDEKDNWGKLKSGAGWISLNGVSKI